MMNTIGDRVLLERRALGIDQEELGKRANVSRPYISQIERNKASNVGLKVVDDLAAALNVSLAYLLGFTDDRTASKVSVQESGPDRKLLEIFHELSEADQFTLLRIAEGLLAQAPR